MTTPFEDALRSMFAAMEGGARIERIGVDVTLDGRREMVVFEWRDDALSAVCTCGAPHCAHRSTALSRMVPGGSAGRVSMRPDAASSTDVRIVEETDRVAPSDVTSLPSTLEDIVTAVVRLGVDSEVTFAVDESLERLVHAAPQPMPLGIRRWIGRLRAALATRDVDAVAHVLEGAGRLIDDLRAEHPDEAARVRMTSWLGAFSGDARGVERISDRIMIEVARERLNGLERSGIERRYLVDLADGAVYREERARAANTASLGPCPRTVHVGLAEVEHGASPRRIRLLQYVTTPLVERAAWEQLRGWAVRDFRTLVATYRDAVSEFPGLAEPFAIVAPDEWTIGDGPALSDERGLSLALTSAEEGSGPEFGEGLPGAAPAWVAGRLVDDRGTLLLHALSGGSGDAGGAPHFRF